MGSIADFTLQRLRDFAGHYPVSACVAIGPPVALCSRATGLAA
jgi:hypothetical protein